jgi:hypothetical protein
MALIVQDRVKVNTTTTGTGTIVLANTAPTGYQSFAVIGDANTTYYTIASQTDNEWEVGIGTYFLANSSLSRTTILSSSNANAAVTFSAGTKDVFVTYPANRAVYEDETGNVAGYPITGGTIDNTSIGATTPSTVNATTITGQTGQLNGTGTNLVTQSQTFSTWTRNQLGLSANSVQAPDGTTTAATLTGDGTSSTHTASFIQTANSFARTWSCFFKSGTNNFVQLMFGGDVLAFANFDLSTGALGTVGASATATITSAGNGWYRCVVTTSSTTATSVFITLITSGTSVRFETNSLSTSIFAWGAQFELGSTANTYIPTTTTAVYGTPTLSFSGVANVTLNSSGTMNLSSAGTGSIGLLTNGGANTQALIAHTANAVNYVQLTGAATGGAATISAQGADSTAQLALTSKGATSLRFYTNTLAAEQFRVSSTTSAVNYAQITGGATGSGVAISAQGSDTNVSTSISAKGTGVILFNSNNAEQFRIQSIASAVNNIQVYGSTTGSGPTLITRGTDTNVDLNIATKGTGAIGFATSGGGAQQLRVTDTASAVNYVQTTGATTGNRPRVEVAGSDTNIDLRLSAKGSGGVYAHSFFVAGANNFNNVLINGAATGSGVIVSASGGDTNIDLKLTPKGTGFANITSGGIKFPDGTTQTTAATAGALAAGNNSIIINNVNITANATIAAGQNGFSVGPITTANGVTVTVSAGQEWVVI